MTMRGRGRPLPAVRCPLPSPPPGRSLPPPPGPRRSAGGGERGHISARTLFAPHPALPFRFRPSAGSAAGEVQRAGRSGEGRRGGGGDRGGSSGGTGYISSAVSALLFPPQARRRHVAATGVAGRAVRGRGGGAGPRVTV